MKPFAISSILSALAASALLTACKSAPPPPPVTTAGLRVQVTEVSWSAKKKCVTVEADIWNDHDQNVTLDFGRIRLRVGDTEASAKPGAYKVRNQTTLQARTKTVVDWDFDLPVDIASGTYTIEMRDLKKGDAPLGEVASFSIEVKV